MRIFHCLWAATLLVAVVNIPTAHAQSSNPTPALPTRPVDPAPATADVPLSQTPRPPITTTPTAEFAPSPVEPIAAPPAVALPVASPGSPVQAAEAQVLRSLISATKDSLASTIKPPPPDLSVKDGVTEMIPVALGRMNRLLTPFPDPVVKFKDNQETDISRAGSILYVLPSTATSISLFVMDKSDPLHAMSLTLVPAAIPPVQVNLHLVGWTAPPQRVAGPSEDAPHDDEPYVRSITQLFRELALKKIPTGFALLKEPPADMPTARCTVLGVRVTPAQWFEGHAVDAIVARAVNTTVDAIDFDESACQGRAVLAVAAWPRLHLEPGEETEVYIAVRRPDPRSDADRPSVLAKRGG